MKDHYRAWIDAWLEENRAYGGCIEASILMAECFPELEVVKGHVYCDWGKRGHWWLVTPDGEIVDPTVSQFGVVFEYEPWKPGDEVRVGKCMNCGDEIWEVVDRLEDIKEKCICSKQCHEAFQAYLESDEP